MYYVEASYSQLKKESIFETLEEALANAQERASKDYEDFSFYVNEIKAVVKADPTAHPVKTLEVTNETKHLLTADESEESSDAAEVQDADSQGQDEVQQEGE